MYVCVSGFGGFIFSLGPCLGLVLFYVLIPQDQHIRKHQATNTSNLYKQDKR